MVDNKKKQLKSESTKFPEYYFVSKDGISPKVDFGDVEGTLMTIMDNQLHAILNFNGVYEEEVESVLNDDIEMRILEGSGALKDAILPMVSIGGVAQIFNYSSYIDPEYIEGIGFKDTLCIMLVDALAKRVAAMRYYKMPCEIKERLQEVWDLNKRDILSQERMMALYNKTLAVNVQSLWKLAK